MTDDKKNIFDKIGDALSNRDEKAAEEAKAEAARKEGAAQAKAATEKMQKEAAERSADRARVAAESKASAEAEEQAKLAAEKTKATQERIQKEFAEKQAQRAAELKQKQAEEAKYIKHTWTNDDTYASLAFKHYGSIKEPYWRLIYEHNKDVIGSHPNNIKTGTEIVIPPLPPELEKKDN